MFSSAASTTSGATRCKPDTPDALPPMPADLPRNRLGFAQWLLRPEHPLTARVTVNRFWQEVFGTGLVRTAGDFGVSGELPSHPELLDWLAVEFRESGWDVKRFFKLMVTSATYRQVGRESRPRSSRKTRRTGCSRAGRGSGWTPRWSATTPWPPAACWSTRSAGRASGPTSPKASGRPWRCSAATPASTSATAASSLYRRSMYTFWKRSAPPASMEIFNAPSREVCTVRRERTNTPLAGARHPQRSAVRRGGPGPGPDRPSSRAAMTSTAGSTSSPARLLARPLPPEEQPGRPGLARSRDCIAFYQSHPEDAARADRRRRVEARAASLDRRPWPPGPCWPTS